MSLKGLVAELRTSVDRLGDESVNLEGAANRLAELLGKEIEEAQKAPEPEADIDHYKIFRSYVEHEDALINNRLTWTTAIQGFLFAIYSFMGAGWNGNETQNVTQAVRQRLVQDLPKLGIFAAIASYVGVLAAVLAIQTLDRDWKVVLKTFPRKAPLPALVGGGNEVAHWMGLFAPILYPIGIGVAWACSMWPNSCHALIFIIAPTLLIPPVLLRYVIHQPAPPSDRT
jgi:hypothetical protein